MLWFVIGSILALIAVLLFIFGKNPQTGESFRVVGFIPLFLAIPLIIVSCLATVGPRNIGVENIKGRTTGETHGAGWVVKAPWVGVEDINASRQPEEYNDPGEPGGENDRRIKVKIADGSYAYITMSYSWRVIEAGAEEAFKDFNKKKDADGDELDILEAIRAFAVSPKMKAALNEEWGTFDPTAGINITPDMTPEQISAIKLNVIPNYGDYNEAIQTNIDEKIKELGGLVSITGITISGIDYSGETQKRIETIKNKILDSKAAMLDVSIKNAQAQGNVALADSLEDPNVLVSKCLDGLIEGQIENQPGFSCWGPSGAVVLPSAK